MTPRKGIVRRVADRIRNRKEPTNRKAPMIERGPAEHPDDERMYISGKVDGISHGDDGSTGRDRAGADIERGSFDGSL